MPRKYKRKVGARPRIPINDNTLRLAVKDVLDGKSIRGTAKRYDISVMTLKRYVRKKQAALQDNNNQDIKYTPDYRQAQIFIPLEEEDLKNYLETASKLYHGLSPHNVRQLAYQYLCENGKIVPPKWHDKEAATYDWFYGFMNRHKSLSLRVPEATSLSRATAFNRHNVGKFFENLKSLMLRFEFRADQIWNIDETGLTTVHKPRKIVACRGLKQVSKVTSGERGELVTVCGAINAVGNHLPPFMIFPRKNWQSRMTDGGPPGTEGAAYQSGWMTGSNFLNFLKFFVKHVRCSKENQCLMVLDNHESHITIDSINFAKENGIHLLTIPPHTSQKLQPLDRILFGTLKSYYNSACDDWMVSHPGRPMTIYDIAGCLGRAYPTAMTPRNIQKSFEITGICPLNSEIFTDDEFLSSFVTDRENPDNNLVDTISATVEVSAAPSSSTLPENDTTETNSATSDVSTAPSLSIVPENVRTETNTATADIFISPFSSTLPGNNPTETNTANIPGVDSMTTAFASTFRHMPTMPSGSKLKNFQYLRPYPKASPRKTTARGRKKGSTKILTDTPEKQAIENEYKARQEKKKRKARAKTVKRNFQPKDQDSTTSEDEELPASPESDLNFSEENDMSCSSSESENDDDTVGNIENDDWLIVNFISEKNLVHRYVGQVQYVNGSSQMVKFAKKVTDKFFKWPIKDDISEIARYQIVKKLPNPKVISSLKMVISFEFPKSLRRFNIE